MPRLLNAEAVSLPKISLSGNAAWKAGYCGGVRMRSVPSNSGSWRMPSPQ